MKLLNKVAIVVGADEIGTTVAKELAKEGAKVVIGGEKKDRVESLAREIVSSGKEAMGIECDPVKSEQVQNLVNQAVAKFGRVDVLVNTVWSNKLVPFVDTTEQMWDEILDKNLKTAFRCIRAVVPTMRKQKYGKIVLLTFLSGISGSGLGEVPFCTAHAGVTGLMRCAAREIGGSKININAVAIGPMEFESYSGIYPKDSMMKMKALISAGRFGKPEDVAGPVVALASDDSSYVTGETVIVGGGFYMS